MTDHPQSIHQRIMGARRATGDGRDFITDGEQAHPAKRRWTKPVFYTLAAVTVLGAGGLGVWQFPVLAESIAPAGKSKTVPPAGQTANQQSAAAQAGAEAGDPFSVHTAQAGIRACAATYNGLGKMLTDGTQFMVQSQTGKTDPDRHALQGVVGMNFHGSQDGGYSGPAAGLVFAAPTGQGCEGTMVRVVPFQQSCQAAAALLPKGTQAQQPLAGVPVFALPAGGQAMLLPSGQGCVAISIIRAG